MSRHPSKSVALPRGDRKTAQAKITRKPKEKDGISALSRGIRVLRAFRLGDSALTNGDLAERTNIPKPTISRITATLTDLGCLNYVEALEAYKLGGASIAIGHVASANFDLLQSARPLMQGLAEDSGLTVAIGTLEKNRMLYMEACQGPALIALQLKVGSRLPLFTSAMGRAYLAMLNRDSREQLAEKYGPTNRIERENSLRAVDRACVELDKQGFCVVAGEWYPDINGLAAPVRAIEGNFVLDCGGPAYTLTQKRMSDEIGPRLADIAKRISTNSGTL
jgi:DNA-binding IclR family transcriptional regulator